MKTFLVQTTDGEVCHDFSFALIEAIKYNNWFYNKKIYDYYLVENLIDDNVLLDYAIKKVMTRSYILETSIPVGSVNFVESYVKKYYNIDINPINIPSKFLHYKYLNRTVFQSLSGKKIKKMLYNNLPKFIKSTDKIKGFTEIVSTHNELDNLNDDSYYFVSDIIDDIVSEWRIFIYNNGLVGVQWYLGDFTLFPNVEFIKEIVGVKNDLSAYTIDIGIDSKNKNFIIEVHNFFSCGLYGFSDYSILPSMFIKGFNDIIQNKGELL